MLSQKRTTGRISKCRPSDRPYKRIEDAAAERTESVRRELAPGARVSPNLTQTGEAVKCNGTPPRYAARNVGRTYVSRYRARRPRSHPDTRGAAR